MLEVILMQICLLFHISLVSKLKCVFKLVENNVFQWYLKVRRHFATKCVCFVTTDRGLQMMEIGQEVTSYSDVKMAALSH